MGDSLLTVVGALLVLAAMLDIAITVLHPTMRAPLNHAMSVLSWRGLRAAAARSGRRLVLTFAAPTAMLLTFAAWATLLSFGFALIYVAHLDLLRSDPAVPFGSADFADALYLSLVALTTVGFGDIVAGSDALRLVTGFEAGCGFAVLTGAVTYAISAYPLVSRARANAVHFSNLGLLEPRGAAMIAVHGDQSVLQAVDTSLIEVHQTFKRFPVLFFFEPRERHESLAVLMRAAIMLCLFLRWGAGRPAAGVRVAFGEALHATLTATMADLRHGYIRGWKAVPVERRMSDAEGRRRFDCLWAALRDVGAEAPDTTDAPRDFLDFLAEADDFLATLEGERLLAERPLLAGSAPGATAAS